MLCDIETLYMVCLDLSSRRVGVPLCKAKVFKDTDNGKLSSSVWALQARDSSQTTHNFDIYCTSFYTQLISDWTIKIH